MKLFVLLQALSVWTGDRVRHYVIFLEQVREKNLGQILGFGSFSSLHKIIELVPAPHPQSQGYALQPDGPRFDKLEEMIRHYYDFNLPKCDVKLTRPYRS